MTLDKLLAVMEGKQSSDVSQEASAGNGITAAELSELIKKLSDARQYIMTPGIEEMRKLIGEKEEIGRKAEALAKKLKCYEEAEKERMASQAHLAQMKEMIDRRDNADERFQGFSGIHYIEETALLTGQYGEEAAKLNQLNSRLNDDRAEYHRCRAEHFSLLGESESYKEKIDRLQHIDQEKGDMVLLLDHMLKELQTLSNSFFPVSAEQKESSVMFDDAVKMLGLFASMLKIKLGDYASVLPEKFLKGIGELL